MRLHRDESGMVGKIIVIWLLLVALLGVVAIDTASIVFTKFRLSDTAQSAATAAAVSYQNSHDVQAACAAAAQSVTTTDEHLRFPAGACKIDPSTGTVTVVLRKDARTIIAGRLSFTKDLTKVVQKETAGPSSL
jgi:hypothetical protein